ncbi:MULTISPECIES: copper homeostasis membrane protein CopD [Pseudomonas]|uniref:copper homeostasis membrane protein CopD n=1 Tax=Pseudomonas TaxID=286 RepID=UPI000875F80C|nr:MULTISPECIES: copper homeostasis membrane protein CopD [Pseudomonas]TFA84553.1 putative copper resistance protein D [Pseudomonas sp. LAIL14HWK12:I2]SCZ29806.1 putative copper resistance protein D [Pseudomonas sp. NFIX46]SDB26764.1 putative copper resistance protein D [Pseudomonas putida]SFQ93176.1 putative copper resistance protein D [Pseudomonas sp. NFIX49]
MAELINILLRLALYVDLLMLFGLALFGLYSVDAVLRFRPMLRGMALIGALLSVAGLVLMTRAMSGETEFAALWPHLQMMVLETDVGLAWALRMIALIAVMIWPGLWLASMAGAVALASLAWSGHGAMDNAWHLLSDILHLLAAGAWLGAMLALILMSRLDALCSEARIRSLADSVKRFEGVGAAIVLFLSITGVANYLFIVGPTLGEVLLGTYGILLAIKVALFGGMLVLAALNRFHLGPLLEQSLRAGQHQVAANALRRSVALELMIALLIVGLVAWLGTLSPEPG